MSAKEMDPTAVGEVDTRADAESTELDSLLQGPVSQPQPEPQVIEADVDGKRVRIVARDEIVLECGDASITLRRNGRIIIKGTHIETCSEGTNRIKGGQVRIN